MKYSIRFLFTLCILSGSAYVLSKTYEVDFDKAMEFEQKDPLRKETFRLKKEHPFMVFAQSLFEKNSLAVLSPMKCPIIPKIVQLIWVGPKPFPHVFYRCLESVKRLLPDWECKIWMDEEVKNLNFENKDLYDAEKNYGAKSDILRYEILYREGGVYLDIDMELVQSLDILHHTYEFYCCLMPCDRIAALNNCVIGAAPGHPIIKACIDELRKRSKVEDVLNRTGPLLFQSVFYEQAPTMTDKRIIAFPKSFFFPLDWKLPDTREELQKLLKPETFGAHHWAGSWIQKEDSQHMRKLWREVNPLLVKDGFVNKVKAAFSWCVLKAQGLFGDK